MNILLVTQDHSINNYGVTTVVSQLANEIASQTGVINIVIATVGTNPVHQSEGISVELMPLARLGARWRWSPDLIGRLNEIISRYHIDLIHIHGIWSASQWAALRIACRNNIPCIVSAHGMLEPWYWDKQGLFKKFKKKIYFNSVFRRALTNKTILHAITRSESENLNKLLPKNKIVVIPNAIGLNYDNNIGYGDKNLIPEKFFLYLGRLHPVKGVDILVEAFFRAKLDYEWKLVLAGPELIPQYSDKIRMAVQNLGLSSRVKLIGPVYGEDKQELIRKAWAVVFPSYCEVIGLVNLEASACMTPSITTYETGWQDWEVGGGKLIHPNVDELSNSILNVSQWSVAERLSRGRKSYALVEKNYSWKAVAPRWEALYSSLVSGIDSGIP